MLPVVIHTHTTLFLRFKSLQIGFLLLEINNNLIGTLSNQ